MKHYSSIPAVSPSADRAPAWLDYCHHHFAMIQNVSFRLILQVAGTYHRSLRRQFIMKVFHLLYFLQILIF